MNAARHALGTGREIKPRDTSSVVARTGVVQVGRALGAVNARWPSALVNALAVPACAVLFATASNPCAAADPAPPSMFRAGPAHVGVYDSPRVPTLARVRWKFRTGGKVIASPAVRDGMVYAASADHSIYALDATTGAVKWRYKTKGAVNSTPAVAGDTLFAASLDGGLHALNSHDGSLRWTFMTGGERRFSAPGIHGATPRTEAMPDPFDVYLSSPTVVDDTVYFGSGDHRVYALDTVSGSLRWTFETGDVVHASPAVVGGVLYIGSWDRNMYALNAATGALIWKFETGNDTWIYNQVGIASSAAVSGGTVFFGCRDGHFYALDARTGAKKWDHDNKKGWTIASPAVADGVVYFPTSDGQRFKALDLVSGAVRFDVRNKAVSFSSPAIAGDAVFYGTSDGWLHAVDRRNGRSIADFQTDGSRQNSARYVGANGEINNAALYQDSTLDAIIVGLDRMFSLGSVLSSPVIADGIVYFGSTDGNVYALE